MLELKNNKHNTYYRCSYLYIVTAVIFKLLLTSYLKRDLAKNNNNNINTLICLAISMSAKVLRDPLVQYSRGLNWYSSIDELAVFGKGRGNTETPSKLFANQSALGQLTNHNTYRFSEGGPLSNLELIEPFVSGWGERYCNNVNDVKNKAIFESPSMRACSSTPPKQNQDFVKEHNRTPLKNSQKSNLSLENKNLKWGEISLWNKCFSLIHIGHN